MPVHPKRGAAGGVAGIAMALMLLTAGCVGPAEVAPSPTASRTAPVFASDEEALAAAEEAYAAYRVVTNLISQESGQGPERIEPYVTQPQLREELVAFAQIRDAGFRQVGDVVVESFLLQSISESEPTIVAAYACLDYSGASFVDGDGVQLPTGRTHSRLVVLVELEADVTGGLRVSGNEPWQEADSC